MNAKLDAVDPYAWMRDTSQPRFTEYLQKQNELFDELMRPVRPLADQLLAEIVERTPPEDDSVPFRFGDYEYSFASREGTEYPCYMRRPAGSSRQPEVLLDYNDFAKDGEYLDIQVCVDRRSTVLAFAVDRTGDRVYSVYFKDLVSGELQPICLEFASGNMVWSKDGKFLFYTELDDQTLRWRRIKRYSRGADPGDAKSVFDDPDETFSCYVYSSKGDDFVLIRRSSSDEDEVLFIPSDDLLTPPRALEPCRPGLEYEVQYDGASLIIRTNLEAPNFRLMRAPLDAISSEQWSALWSPEEGAFLEDFEVIRGAIAVKERIGGIVRCRLLESAQGGDTIICPAELNSSIEFTQNVELDTRAIRYERSFYVIPTRTCEYNLDSRTTTMLKQERVCGAFNPDDYVAEQRLVERPGAVHVPLTLLYRRDHGLTRGPVLLHSYGAYGFSIDPYFWLPRFSLLDRGFVFAIAHVRGGGELGRAWHAAGRRHRKPDSIGDYIACAEYLRDTGISDPSNLYAMGESAGGLLVGAALNERPDIFRAVVMIAPFVDILNSLSDPTIPLTTTDFSEWGDPNKPADRSVIRSYSPYDNIREQAYPHILAMSRMNDTQVAVWEPAKWLARIRDMSTSRNHHILRTEFDTGHMGRSGRHAQFRDTAIAYAFLIGVHTGQIS
jgi:oligopeptidase B